MSGRPTHSFAGYVRLMQMSRADLFVFVEGWTDRSVYDQICDSECKATGHVHEVRTPRELPGAPSGKAALLGFFDYVRRRKALKADFKGKRTSVLFFLDKDIDDVLGRRRRSNHVVYTEHYDMENYLYLHGNLVAASATAAALDLATARRVVGTQAAWCARAAREWRTWVELCVLGHMRAASCRVSYRLVSWINLPSYGGVNPAAEATARSELASATGLTVAQLPLWTSRVARCVDNAFTSGNPDQVFKGKWYKHFIAADLRAAAASRTINSNGLEDRVTEMLKLNLDVLLPWTSRYRTAIQNAVSIV